jgi:hypothetical protein
MYGKTQTYGNPNLTFRNGKNPPKEKQHKHRRKFGDANAPQMFFYLTTFFFCKELEGTNKHIQIFSKPLFG